MPEIQQNIVGKTHLSPQKETPDLLTRIDDHIAAIKAAIEANERYRNPHPIH